MPSLPLVPTAPVAAGSLLGGYALGRATGVRPLAGVVLLAGAATCAHVWWRTAGPVATVALTAGYLGAFGLAHPLAKKIGAWPAVVSASAATGLASYLVADRRA